MTEKILLLSVRRRWGRISGPRAFLGPCPCLGFRRGNGQSGDLHGAGTSGSCGRRRVSPAIACPRSESGSPCRRASPLAGRTGRLRWRSVRNRYPARILRQGKEMGLRGLQKPSASWMKVCSGAGSGAYTVSRHSFERADLLFEPSRAQAEGEMGRSSVAGWWGTSLMRECLTRTVTIFASR